MLDYGGVGLLFCCEEVFESGVGYLDLYCVLESFGGVIEEVIEHDICDMTVKCF